MIRLGICNELFEGWDFARVCRTVKAIGYDGYVSLELMNPTLWQMKPVQVVEIGLTALRRVLGLAQPAG